MKNEGGGGPLPGLNLLNQVGSLGNGSRLPMFIVTEGAVATAKRVMSGTWRRVIIVKFVFQLLTKGVTYSSQNLRNIQLGK